MFSSGRPDAGACDDDVACPQSFHTWKASLGGFALRLPRYYETLGEALVGFADRIAETKHT
jgi:hypothetical protein